MNRRVSTALVVVFGVGQLLGAFALIGALLGWGFASPFRYLSDPMLLQLETVELSLLLAAALYLFSTVCLVATLEANPAGQTQSRRVPLLGLIPLFGVASHFFLRPSESASSNKREEEPKKRGQTVPAAIVIALASMTVILGVYFVLQIGNRGDTRLSMDAASSNREAFSAIEKIAEAQARYKLEDWDGDSKKEYALFVVHLWRTGRLKKEPAQVGLIAEELAVARNPETAYRGYSFRNLHFRETSPPPEPSAYEPSDSHLQKLDYSAEWALIAEPQVPPVPDDPNERLQFLALSDGRIFARPSKGNTVDAVPFEFEKTWSPVESIDDIKVLEGSGP